MKIYYTDGGILEGNSIAISGNAFIIDDIYTADIDEIERIEED